MRITQAGELVGSNLALIEQGRDQPVGDAAVLCTFAYRVNTRIKCLHGVVDDDAAFTVQAGLFGQFDIRDNADTHDNEVGLDFTAVLETYALYAAIADDFLGSRFHQEGHAAFFQRCLQKGRRRFVELAFHQAIQQVHHGDVHTLFHQAVGRFQAQQAAANDDGLFVILCSSEHGVDIVNVAEGNHTVLVMARYRDHERVGPGSQQQSIIVSRGAVFGDDLLVYPVDFGD